jgi:hypothetical protein
MQMTRADTSGILATVTPEYSTMTPFNSDNTRFLLEHFAYFGLYDGSGNFLGNLPLEINASSEPRWSRGDSNVVYYRSNNQLKQYNVSTSAIAVVRTFTEYSLISGRGESDISFDGNHFVFVGDGRYVFVYEISTDTKGNVFDTGGLAFDGVQITPQNNVTITWIASGASRNQGVELFDSNMNFLRQLARAGGHMDVTRDTNGDEVALWMNANDPTPICNNGLVKIRISDGLQTCLVTFDWTLAAHFSATDNSGWAFVGTIAPSDPVPPAGWFTYTAELMQVKLDGSQVRRLAHHRSRPFNSYTYQPKISVSRDGRKLVYGSNFGLQQILGYPTEYSDAYMIDMSVVSPDTLGTAYGLTLPGPNRVADFNGDGKMDLVWQHDTTGQISAWFMDGINMIGSATFPAQAPDVGWKLVGTGDFNRDGKTDLVWQHMVTGQIGVRLMNGVNLVSDLFFSPSSVGDTAWKIVTVGDFNADGKPDLVWQREGTGESAVWLMDGTSLMSGLYFNPAQETDTNWNIVGMGDFNNDGQPDLAWHHAATGEIKVWWMNGVNRMGEAPLDGGPVPDVSWRVAGVGDLNGDGRPDLIWQHMLNGLVGVWFMNGTNRMGASLFNPPQVSDPQTKIRNH